MLLMLSLTRKHPIIVLVLSARSSTLVFFFFNDTATTEIYTLSLHDALPILLTATSSKSDWRNVIVGLHAAHPWRFLDRKSTRLNSSHIPISYAVFCLKKKTNHVRRQRALISAPFVLLHCHPRSDQLDRPETL